MSRKDRRRAGFRPPADGAGLLDALLSRAAELRDAGRFQEAEAHCRRALEARPHDPKALGTLGGVLQLQGRFADAIAVADAAIAVDPSIGEAWITRGDSLLNAGRPSEAVAAYGRAGEIPGFQAMAKLRLGKTYKALGEFELALAAFEDARRRDPESADAIHESGILRLELGQFSAGWAGYEARWRSASFIARSRGFVPEGMIPLLTTSPSVDSLRGRRILLIGEQGIGDQVMFGSMLPDLAAVAASVVCLCEPRLLRLFSASFPGIRFVHPSGARIDGDSVDVLLAMGSLGAAFRSEPEDFPGSPYLQPPDDVRRRWAERLGPRSDRLRVGLSWRGGLPSTRRPARSIPLEHLAPLLELPGIEFFDLQYGDVAAEREAVNARLRNPIRAIPPADLTDFEEFAGAVANLDAVVSVQNAAVHLAGALGTTCLAMLPVQPEWRYMRRGSRMPWYKSVELFRQAEPGDWAPVVARVAAALQDLARAPRPGGAAGT